MVGLILRHRALGPGERRFVLSARAGLYHQPIGRTLLSPSGSSNLVIWFVFRGLANGPGSFYAY